jgi:hypothetical protein
MRSRAPLLIVIATTGCMNEYHPEYHPVTTTTLIENVSSPITVTNEGAPEASNLKIDLPPKYDALVPSQPRVDPQPQIEPKTALIDDARVASRHSAKCDLPPSQPPGTYLGPHVQIGPGVTFGGNVYVQGNLIIGGTREHPVLTTTQ